MHRSAIAIFLGVGLTPTGCGTEADGGDSDSGSAEIQEVTLGLIPIADVAPIHLGIDNGFFEDKGISLDIEYAAGGAALIPAVVSGDYEFAYSNVTSLIQANSRGLDLKIVAPGVATTGVSDEDYGGFIASGQSSIESVSDLEGHTIGVNTLNNVDYVLVRSALESAGVDIGDVDIIEVPFPDQPAALANNQIQAMWGVEPFVTMALDDGGLNLGSLYAEESETFSTATYFASEALIESDPELVERFSEAVEESLAYASEHPEEARESLESFTSISPSLLSRITLPAWPDELDEDSIELQLDFATRFELIDGPVELEDLVH